MNSYRRLRYPLVALSLMAVVLVAIACNSPAAESPALPAATSVSQPADTATNPPMAATAGSTATTAPATSPAVTPPQAGAAATTSPPATAVQASTAAAPPSTADEPEGFLFKLEEGSVARYKVQEVLANTGLKIATGVTEDVEGSISIDADGNVVAEDSWIVVQAATLRTDSNRRDGYVRNRTLETDEYPEIAFQPTAIEGLPASLDEVRGTHEFTITGGLTIKDQTREVTWDATADFGTGGQPTGTASVVFSFEDFAMTKPSVAVVLSVGDTIRLELDFTGSLTTR